ncbi:unnamed protein product [Choristocarpus tenellus]
MKQRHLLDAMWLSTARGTDTLSVGMGDARVMLSGFMSMGVMDPDTVLPYKDDFFGGGRTSDEHTPTEVKASTETGRASRNRTTSRHDEGVARRSRAHSESPVLGTSGGEEMHRNGHGKRHGRHGERSNSQDSSTRRGGRKSIGQGRENGDIAQGDKSSSPHPESDRSTDWFSAPYREFSKGPPIQHSQKWADLHRNLNGERSSSFSSSDISGGRGTGRE